MKGLRLRGKTTDAERTFTIEIDLIYEGIATLFAKEGLILKFRIEIDLIYEGTEGQ